MKKLRYREVKSHAECHTAGRMDVTIGDSRIGFGFLESFSKDRRSVSPRFLCPQWLKETKCSEFYLQLLSSFLQNIILKDSPLFSS